MLETASTSETIGSDQLRDLAGLKVIPDARRVLTRPMLLYFEDRPGLAARFGELIRNSIIARYQNAWRAMEAAGVTPLSKAVRTDLVECSEAAPAEDLSALLRERKGALFPDPHPRYQPSKSR